MFGFGKPYFLGIDFGTSLIKAVELTMEDGKPVLVNYGQVDLSALEKRGASPSDRSYDEEVVLYLRALLERFHPKSRGAYIAMPAFIGLISLIEFPEMAESELQEAIRFEAHKYVPSSLDEVALSWDVIGTRPPRNDGKPKMEVLLVAALNKEVERYEGYMRSTHIGLDFLELETFSLVRSIIGNRPGLSMLIDIGSRATNLILVEDGIVRVSRNLDVGGRDITHTIMDGFSITQERAETLKKSGKDFLNNPESALVFPALQMIASEGERMLVSYATKYPEIQCQEVVLSGGTAQLAGLVRYYSQLFNLPISIGNPWERVMYDPSLAPVIEKLGASFSVALGLAFSGVDALEKKKEKKLL